MQLEGQYFQPKVQAGERVQAGDLLIEFDVEKIIAQVMIQLHLLSSQIRINMK
ncbi:PTS glucose transporter subunit IIA [Bacillus sp. SL00103]